MYLLLPPEKLRNNHFFEQLCCSVEAFLFFQSAKKYESACVLVSLMLTATCLKSKYSRDSIVRDNTAILIFLQHVVSCLQIGALDLQNAVLVPNGASHTFQSSHAVVLGQDIVILESFMT